MAVRSGARLDSDGDDPVPLGHGKTNGFLRSRVGDALLDLDAVEPRQGFDPFTTAWGV